MKRILVLVLSASTYVDGEIFQDARLVPLNPDSEIYLIPKIGGA